MSQWFITITAENGGYDTEESYVESWAPAGIVGPFDSREEADAYDREHFLKEYYMRTEVVTACPPGTPFWEHVYPHAPEVAP